MRQASVGVFDFEKNLRGHPHGYRPDGAFGTLNLQGAPKIYADLKSVMPHRYERSFVYWYWGCNNLKTKDLNLYGDLDGSVFKNDLTYRNSRRKGLTL